MNRPAHSAAPQAEPTIKMHDGWHCLHLYYRICQSTLAQLSEVAAELGLGFSEADLHNPYQGPSWSHPLGTDRFGHDMLSRAIWSAQTTVIISVAVVVTGGLIFGVALGLLSGYLRGPVDYVIMRLAEIFGSVPAILLLLIITSTLLSRAQDLGYNIEDLTGQHWIVSSGAPSYFLVFGALASFGWVGLARLVRSQVLSLREAPYITAAQASGASHRRILFWHLLPNLSNLLTVSFTLSLGAVAGAEVGLTFLGIGVQSGRTICPFSLRLGPPCVLSIEGESSIA